MESHQSRMVYQSSEDGNSSERIRLEFVGQSTKKEGNIHKVPQRYAENFPSLWLNTAHV